MFCEGLKLVSGSVKIRREVRENMIQMHCKGTDLRELMKMSFKSEISNSLMVHPNTLGKRNSKSKSKSIDRKD